MKFKEIAYYIYFARACVALFKECVEFSVINTDIGGGYMRTDILTKKVTWML